MKSPCIDVCRFDKPTGWCIGCGRTLDECRKWQRASPGTLKVLSTTLPRRMAKLREKWNRQEASRGP